MGIGDYFACTCCWIRRCPHYKKYLPLNVDHMYTPLLLVFQFPSTLFNCLTIDGMECHYLLLSIITPLVHDVEFWDFWPLTLCYDSPTYVPVPLSSARHTKPLFQNMLHKGHSLIHTWEIVDVMFYLTDIEAIREEGKVPVWRIKLRKAGHPAPSSGRWWG